MEPKVEKGKQAEITRNRAGQFWKKQPLAMRFYLLILGTLCVWRITHLLNAEDGPWNLLVKFRQILGQGFWGKLLDCFYCLSLWIAIPFAVLIGEGRKERLLLWPALSGAAILLERLTSKAEPASPPFFAEDQEDPNVLR
jgi:hypothetical protein